MCNICVDKINAIEGWIIEYSIPNGFTSIINKENTGGYLVSTEDFHKDIDVFIKLCSDEKEIK